MATITPLAPLHNRRERRQRSGETVPARAASLQPEARNEMPASVRRLPNALGQAALLEWLGQTPISFHRVYVDIAGGVLPALWLSCAMARVARASAAEFEPNGDFVFTMSSSDCERETGISRGQQAGCRRHLIAQGLISELAEQRRATRYRLHLDRIARRLLIQAGPLAESLQLVSLDAAALAQGRA